MNFDKSDADWQNVLSAAVQQGRVTLESVTRKEHLKLLPRDRRLIRVGTGCGPVVWFVAVNIPIGRKA